MPPPAGTPIPSLEPLGKFQGIAAFKPGLWDGGKGWENVTSAHLREMVDNWAELSKPQGDNNQPYYVPFVSLKHNDTFACGEVSRVYQDKTGVLRIDADKVPESVGALRNTNKLHSPSIEYWLPGEFAMPDGSLNKTRVLKCVTLLGGDAPAVKGLGPLPVATYSHHGPTRRYAAGARMDRQAMIAALTAAGADVSMITDAVPEEVLAAWLKSIQALSAQPVAAPASPPVTMAAPTGTPAAPATPTLPNLGALPQNQPSTVTLKYGDGRTAQMILPPGASIVGSGAHVGATDPAIYQMIQQQNAILAGLTQQVNANNAANAAALSRAKEGHIRAFCDRMTDPKVAKMQPSQVEPFVRLHMKLDYSTVRKYADGVKQGTELQEALDSYEATAPVIRSFGGALPQPLTPPNGATTAGNPSGATPELRIAMLNATPIGRATLEREKKEARQLAAKNN